MSLIKSISGIRGTLGGLPGRSLTPLDIVRFAAAFGARIKPVGGKRRVVIGRDARPSGQSISQLAAATLQHMGIEVIDIGLSTTPTVALAVGLEKASGGMVVTASHNPSDWNALKLLNSRGEFVSAREGETILAAAEQGDVVFAPAKALGAYQLIDRYIERHVALAAAYPLVNVAAIRRARFKVVVDAVNSTGGIAIPLLLKKLGVSTIKKIYCTPDGLFPHNPEPLPAHLKDLAKCVKTGGYDLGIAVDPDVDRLALIQEDGRPFGEEYTLVAVADYILSQRKGAVVSNLSSTRALRDVVVHHGCRYYASAVGEVNVVAKMKAVRAVIGGEGNGGVIVPDFHYGRDALIGVALFLTHLARSRKTASALRKTYPPYFIAKQKLELDPALDYVGVLNHLTKRYAAEQINTVDGLKIEFGKSRRWVHIRQSNTEPILRLYAEAPAKVEAEQLAQEIIEEIYSLTFKPHEL